MSTGRDAWRLAVGTLTAFRVQPPAVVDRAVAGRAMLLAPLATLPLAAIPLLAHVAVRWIGMPPLLAAALTVAVIAWLSRGLHLDGLADTADGLAASFDRQRALEVMRRGDVGPMGAAALVLVLLIQVAGISDLLGWPSWDGPILAAVAVLASRHTLAWVCGPAFPAARDEGLGATVAGTVPVGAAAGVVGWYAASLTVVAAVGAAWLVAVRCRMRLGGVTGDVLGAAVEVSLAAGLIVAATLR